MYGLGMLLFRLYTEYPKSDWGWSSGVWTGLFDADVATENTSDLIRCR